MCKFAPCEGSVDIALYPVFIYGTFHNMLHYEPSGSPQLCSLRECTHLALGLAHHMALLVVLAHCVLIDLLLPVDCTLH